MKQIPPGLIVAKTAKSVQMTEAFRLKTFIIFVFLYFCKRKESTPTSLLTKCGSAEKKRFGRRGFWHI